MKDGLTVRRHQERHALVGGGQRLHGDAGQGGGGLPAGEHKALGGGFRREAPLFPVPVRQADAPAQEEADLPPAVVQGEDLGVEVVRVPVAGAHQQGLSRRQRGQLPLPPVEEQAYPRQLHQEAAVVQKGDGHPLNFTAVP